MLRIQPCGRLAEGVSLRVKNYQACSAPSGETSLVGRERDYVNLPTQRQDRSQNCRAKQPRRAPSPGRERESLCQPTDNAAGSIAKLPGETAPSGSLAWQGEREIMSTHRQRGGIDLKFPGELAPSGSLAWEGEREQINKLMCRSFQSRSTARRRESYPPRRAASQPARPTVLQYQAPARSQNHHAQRRDRSAKRPHPSLRVPVPFLR